METIVKKINKNEIIDQEDFRNLALFFCEDKGFPYLLKDVSFDDTFYDIAAYRPRSRVLVFNFDKVEDLAIKSTKSLQDIYDIPDESLNPFLNFNLLYVIYHELRHIEQDYDRDCNVNNNPAFSYLYDISTIAGRDQAIYTKFHDLFPIEIDANNYGFIYSYLMLLKSDISLRQKKIFLLQVYNSILHQYKLENKKLVSPIEMFSEKVGCINLEYLFRLIKKSKIDSCDKLIHGLPVSKYEHYKLYVKKNKTLKTINR